MSDTDANPQIGLYISIAVAVSIIAGLLWLLLAPTPEPEPQPRTTTTLTAPPVAAPEPTPVEPKIEPAVVATPKVAPEPEVDPLPSLDQSDLPVRFAVGDLFQSETLNNWLIADQLLRRFVVIVDNMADGKLVYKHHVIPSPEGSFRANRVGNSLFMDSKNYQRYASYIKILDSLDPQQAAQVYKKYLPLLEDAYRELGYPNRRFEDRMRQAIDLIAQTNIIDTGAVELIQPSVHYRYAKEELESLNAVHKLLIRLGPENSAIVQRKLKAIRTYL